MNSNKLLSLLICALAFLGHPGAKATELVVTKSDSTTSLALEGRSPFHTTTATITNPKRGWCENPFSHPSLAGILSCQRLREGIPAEMGSN